MSKNKFIIKDISHSMTKTLSISNQPYMDDNGNIDMHENTLHVNKLKITNDTMLLLDCENGNNHTYENFYSGIVDLSGNNLVAGTIRGSNHQTLYGSLMDTDVITLCNYSADESLHLDSQVGKYKVLYQPQSTSHNTTDEITYNTWLDSVKALTPITYVYGNNTDNTVGKFASIIKSDTRDYLAYQGIDTNTLNKVYPPALSCPRWTKDDNGKDIYQQVDMSKLVPMCIGAIKQLDTSINSLTTDLANAKARITDLETLNLLNNWTIKRVNNEVSILYTTIDGSDGWNTYISRHKILTSTKWGASQYNSSITEIEIENKIIDQLTELINANIDMPTDIKYIYKFADNNGTYKYDYYTIDELGLDDHENSSDPEGRIGLIYDARL